MKFDLQDSIDFILDKNNSAQLRAVELFTFLVALHLGRSATTISGHGSLKNECPSLTLKVPDAVEKTQFVPAAILKNDSIYDLFVFTNLAQISDRQLGVRSFL